MFSFIFSNERFNVFPSLNRSHLCDRAVVPDCLFCCNCWLRTASFNFGRAEGSHQRCQTGLNKPNTCRTMQGTIEGCKWAETLHQLRIRAADQCELTVTGFFSGAVPNPCAVQNGGCMHECRLDGTRPRCDCRVGFILAEDRKTCQGRFH